MRVIDILNESNGIKAGTPGELYTAADGTEYAFQKWNWQFPVRTDKYEDLEQMQADILKLTGNDQNKIFWCNQPNRAKSFGYATFKADNGQEIWVGKFFQMRKPTNTIYDGELTQFAGLSKPKSSAAVKESANLKPSAFGLNDTKARGAKTIESAVLSHSSGAMLAPAFTQLMSGQAVTFLGGAGIAKALQDDFGEIVAPVAMTVGHPVITGQLDLAIGDVFGGGDLKGATIGYPVDENAPLIDSYIYKGGRSLGVSSKGKTGAKATITNIWKAKEEAAQSSNGPALVAKFAAASEILDICEATPGRYQPVDLAIKFKLINAQEAETLRAIVHKDVALLPQYQLVGDPNNPNAVVRQPTKTDLAKVPPELMRIFKSGGYKSGSYVSLLCLAQVAHMVARHINADPKINFGEAIRQFLNSSAMVQANTVIVGKGKDAVLRSINISYPPNFKEKAKMESNGYSGKQIKGKFSFSLPTT
jgi:hypothetical protein